MANDLEHRITAEEVVRQAADKAASERIAIVGTMLGTATGTITATMFSPKPSFLKDVTRGAMNVAKVLWQVPAARGLVATLLVRFGVPGTLLAIGMAVGDKVLGS